MKGRIDRDSSAMKMPIVVIGLGIVVVGRTLFGGLRASYLKRASERVSIDNSQEIVLRYALWYYAYPALAFAWSVFFGWAGIHEQNVVRFRFDMAFFFIGVLGGFWLLYRQWNARVKILDGKLTYTEGDRWEILANEVNSVSIAGFTFIVRKRSDKVVRIPATFQHSEIILAFLKKAAANRE
jgi:hypothetical protein